MDHPDLIVCSCMTNAIGLKRVNCDCLIKIVYLENQEIMYYLLLDLLFDLDRLGDLEWGLLLCLLLLGDVDFFDLFVTGDGEFLLCTGE